MSSLTGTKPACQTSGQNAAQARKTNPKPWFHAPESAASGAYFLSNTCVPAAQVLAVCPSVRAVAHLHHLPVLPSVQCVELVGSDLVGRGWRGAVVFASALRHALLGLRDCLLVSWGDGVRECWNLHNIHTMFCLYEHLGKLFLVGMGQIYCDNYSKNYFYHLCHRSMVGLLPQHTKGTHTTSEQRSLLSLCGFKSTYTFSFVFFFLLFFPLGSGEADRGLSFRLFFLSGGWSLLGVSSAAETLPCLKQRQGVQSSCRRWGKGAFSITQL